MMRVIQILIMVCMFGPSVACAIAYHYEERKTDGQVVYVVTINPNEYNMRIVKAQSTRETVPSIAKRLNAQIAINGGFFDIGAHRDGMPSGSLVIQGKRYKVKNQIQALAIINSGIFSIQLTNTKEFAQKNMASEYSLVSGIPLLINHGKIVQNLFEKKGDFYTKPHARTAIGIRSDGVIVLCVVGGKIHVKGFTIVELANFMKKLGCEFAINLDGGGSSTLWVDGKVRNHTMGDEDEGYGLDVVRPVSDAIIFNKKV